MSGGSLSALVYFLEHHPAIENVFICTDMDEAGEIIADKICALPKEDGRFTRISIKADPPIFGNDWNDTLMEVQESARAKTKGRAGISI